MCHHPGINEGESTLSSVWLLFLVLLFTSALFIAHASSPGIPLNSVAHGVMGLTEESFASTSAPLVCRSCLEMRWRQGMNQLLVFINFTIDYFVGL